MIQSLLPWFLNSSFYSSIFPLEMNKFNQIFFIALGWLQLDFSANNLIKFAYPCRILFRASVMKHLSLLCLSVQWQEVLNAFWTCLVNWGMIVLTEEVSTSPNDSKAEKMHKSCKNILYVILGVWFTIRIIYLNEETLQGLLLAVISRSFKTH